MKKLSLLILGTFLLIGVAQANVPAQTKIQNHLTGVYFGPSVAAVNVDFGNWAKIYVNEGQTTYQYGRSGKAANSLNMTGGLFIGYAHLFENNVFFLGIEGQYNTTFGNRNIQSTNDSTYGSPSHKVVFEPEWQIVVRPGYLITPRLLGYMNLGVAKANITSEFAGGIIYPYDTSFTKESKELLGVIIGVGAQYIMSEHLSFRLSFNATKYSDDKFNKAAFFEGQDTSLRFAGEVAPVTFNSELSLVYTL